MSDAYRWADHHVVDAADGTAVLFGADQASVFALDGSVRHVLDRWRGHETIDIADAPPPLSADKSAASFRQPPGYRIDLVASEPLVREPSQSDAGLFVAGLPRDYCVSWEAGAAGAVVDYRLRRRAAP